MTTKTAKTTSKADTKATAPAADKLLEQIALDHLFIETLQTKNRDALDFHDVSVWAVKSALQAAYQAGLTAANATAKAAA